MHPETQQWLSLLQNPTFLILLFWLVKELFALSKNKVKDIDLALKENSQKMSELSVSLARLDARLEGIQRLVDRIPELVKDTDALHDKMRGVSQ